MAHLMASKKAIDMEVDNSRLGKAEKYTSLPVHDVVGVAVVNTLDDLLHED